MSTELDELRTICQKRYLAESRHRRMVASTVYVTICFWIMLFLLWRIFV